MEVNGLCVALPSAHARFAIEKIRVKPNKMEQKTSLNLKEFPVICYKKYDATILLFLKVVWYIS